MSGVGEEAQVGGKGKKKTSEKERDGQSQEEDTINRRNRMKLRCVREVEKRRAGGGESERA